MPLWVMFGWYSNLFSVLSIYGKAWQTQFLVVLLNIPSFPSQLFLPPSLNVLPEIEPLSDPFVDEFEFGGVGQESEDEASIPYPAETIVDQRLVSTPLNPLEPLEYMSASNLLHLVFHSCIHLH